MTAKMPGPKRQVEILDAAAEELAADRVFRPHLNDFNRVFDGHPFSNGADDNPELILYRRRVRAVARVTTPPPVRVVAPPPTDAAPAEPTVEVAKPKRRARLLGAVGLAILVLAGAASAVAMNADENERPPFAYTQPEPKVLEAALGSEAALLATGTCARELRAQADIEISYQAADGAKMDASYRDRPSWYLDAVDRAARVEAPCTPPANNLAGTYVVASGQSITGSDLVRIELGESGAWCAERRTAEAAIAAPDTPQADRSYQEIVITFGDAAARMNNIVCAA